MNWIFDMVNSIHDFFIALGIVICIVLLFCIFKIIFTYNFRKR